MYFGPVSRDFDQTTSCLSPGLSIDFLTHCSTYDCNRLCVLLDLDCYLCTLISSLAIDQYLLSYRLVPLPTYNIIIILLIANSTSIMLFICDLKFENVSGWGDLHGHLGYYLFTQPSIKKFNLMITQPSIKKIKLILELIN